MDVVQGVVVVEQGLEAFLQTSQLAVAQLTVHLHAGVHTCAVPA